MLLNLLQHRHSVRDFSPKKAALELIQYILEAGRLSPSGGNEQPWYFGVITDKDCMQDIAAIAYNQDWMKKAAFLIVLCTKIVPKEKGGRNIQMSRYPELADLIQDMDDDVWSKLHLEEHQTKIPGTHMMLAALEKGLSSTWVSYFRVQDLSQYLNLPEHCYASEIIAFGYPEHDLPLVEKKDIDELVFYDTYTSSKNTL